MTLPYTGLRLCIDQPPGEGQTIRLTADHANYLFRVMRLGPGDRLGVFDGQGSDEWAAEVAETGRRGGTLRCLAPIRPHQPPADLWLLFAPVKKARTDFIVEKATELGAARILPVSSEFTNAGRVNRARLAAHAREAVEQCGGTHLPEVAALAPLGQVLEGWDGARRLMVCDEGRAGAPAAPPAAGDAAGPWAVLIGPEGGFSEAERARLSGMEAACPVSLGPRILRADTAAVAALALWQARFGEWAAWR